MSGASELRTITGFFTHMLLHRTGPPLPQEIPCRVCQPGAFYNISVIRPRSLYLKVAVEPGLVTRESILQRIQSLQVV